MNKNKKKCNGFSLVELVVSIFILSMVFQIISGYLKNISKDKKIIEKIQKVNKGISPIILKLQEAIYEGSGYKIYKYNSEEYEYDNSYERGKVLILERVESIEPLKYEYNVYSIRDKQLISELGYREGDKIKIYKRKGETILKNIELEFVLRDFGIEMKGYYLNEKIEKTIYY